MRTHEKLIRTSLLTLIVAMTTRAILLSTTTDTQEMSNLLRTLAIDIVQTVVQKRPSPHRNTFLGPGKIDEIADDLTHREVNLIIVNGLLTGGGGSRERVMQEARESMPDPPKGCNVCHYLYNI